MVGENMAIDFSTSRGCSRRVQPAVYGVLLLPAHIHPAAFLLHHRGRKKLPLCVCERVDVCVVREQSERFSCASLARSPPRSSLAVLLLYYINIIRPAALCAVCSARREHDFDFVNSAAVA
jgi:hypothetical protein